MFSVGTVSRVTVQEPSQFLAATGPPTGSQLHQGPVNLTLSAAEVARVVKLSPFALDTGTSTQA